MYALCVTSVGDFLFFCFRALLYITASCSLPKEVFCLLFRAESTVIVFTRPRSNALVSSVCSFQNRIPLFLFCYETVCTLFSLHWKARLRYEHCFIALADADTILCIFTAKDILQSVCQSFVQWQL